MKKYSSIFSMVLISIFILISACSGKPTQITATQSTVEIVDIGTSEPATATMEPGSTIKSKFENDAKASLTPTITEILQTPTSSPEIYPPPIITSPASGITSPYPVQNSEPTIPGNMVEPYPQPLINTPISVNTQDPYPPPVLNPNATQPIAINPIQTPIATVEATANSTSVFTITAIVSSKITASDPASVQLISGKYQLIEFFAFWCPFSKSMAPVMNGLENKYQGRVAFIYLDIDNPANKPFKDALGYKVQPHTFLLDGDGKILHQWKGFTPVEDLEAVLTPLFP